MKQFKNAAQVFIFLLALYSVLRLGFFLVNREFFQGTGSMEILIAFVVGLRFDTAGILLINFPIAVLFLVPYKPLQWKWYRVLLFSLFVLINLAGILLNVADYGYYPTVQRRLLYEPYSMLPDIWRMLPGVIRHHYILTGLFLLAGTAFIVLCVRYFRLIRAGEQGKRNAVSEIGAFLILIALSVIGIRGGLQLKPIRQTNAFFSAHTAVGYLALNSTYTVVRSMFQERLPHYTLLPQDQARTLLADMLWSQEDSLLNPQFPFLRRHNAIPSREKLNVVIIIMESWSAQSMGILNAKSTCTPFFDSLSAHGILFSNFIASGQRSIEAVPAVLTSVPALYHASLIGSKEEMDAFRGLGAILTEQGYTTSFHHGAQLGSMGFDAFTRIAGFMRYYSKEDTRNLDDSKLDGVWGVYDEPFFLESAQRISELPQPFCSVIFSLSSHDPFHLPPGLKGWAERYRSDSEFELSLRYSDYSLRRFFTRIASASWFRNTVFLITGDHTFYAMRNNLYETFHIPLLIFQPNANVPERIDRIGSQVDILPTILDILQIPVVHSSMGRSLLDSSRTHYAVVKFGAGFVIFDDTLVLIHDLEKTVGLFRYRSDPFTKIDLQSTLPDDTQRLKDRLFAYLQETTSAIARDKINKK
jgi:phosphoglycerol transferase MdoB-like AlkP superfamily enzyme